MFEFQKTRTKWTSRPALFESRETKRTLSPSLIFVWALSTHSHKTESLCSLLSFSFLTLSAPLTAHFLQLQKSMRFESTGFEYLTSTRWSTVLWTPDFKLTAKIWTLYRSKFSPYLSAFLSCTLVLLGSFASAAEAHLSWAYSLYSPSPASGT